MSGYDRPHDRWQCGDESPDGPCGAGPTCRGRCPALGECSPIRDGDRWVCNRSDNRGGPCDQGPTPEGRCCRTKTCRPKRSLRSIRGRWLRGATVFTVGALLMLVGARSRNELAVPGDLTSHHAQVIARGDGSNRCAACHPGANDSLGGWLASAWNGHPQTTQSALCLECHQDLATPGAEPLLAHGLPPEALPGGERRATPASLAGLNPLGSPALGAEHGDSLACAACHQEHHGAEHDLAAITDARCQACHTERYDHFANDHPDFGLWPTTRRTRIAFNHASHGGEHFLKANRDFDCRSCHQEDTTGDLTARPTYQQACADCHDADLVNSFGEGLPFLALPTIDPQAIRDAGGELPAWPREAEGDFDGDLPVFTKLLLAADPSAREAMRELGEDFSFFDVDSDETVPAAAAIVTSLADLLNGLQEEGHGAIAYRLRSLLGDTTAAEADYVGRLPIELIDRIQATWLGGKQPPAPYDAIEDRTTGGGWRIDDQRLTLAYRPTGHDDPLLKVWLDAIVALPEEHAGLREACLEEFARAGAPGGCLDCHSVEAKATGGFLINWRGRDRLAEPRGFTHFSHRPHLVQPELSDCRHCHEIDEATSRPTAYSGADPSRFASEFVGLSKAACVQCHQPHAAGDSCTQCHNYHVDPPGIAFGVYHREGETPAEPDPGTRFQLRGSVALPPSDSD